MAVVPDCDGDTEQGITCKFYDVSRGDVAVVQNPYIESVINRQVEYDISDDVSVIDADDAADGNGIDFAVANQESKDSDRDSKVKRDEKKNHPY